MSKGCTCEKCIEMCRTYPCMPLPKEAERLIQAGYGELLMLDTLNWKKTEHGKILSLRPAMMGYEHDTVDDRHVVIEVCSECGQEYQFFRRSP